MTVQRVKVLQTPLPGNAAQETGGNLEALAESDFATSAKQDTILAALADLLAELAQKLEAGGSIAVLNFPATQPVSGTVAVSNLPATQPVSIASMPSTPVTGPLTDAQLRANAVPVSLASVPSHPVTGPLTNAELRASAIPVSMGAPVPLTFVSAKTAAPAANAVQCDTGALPAGDYELDIHLSVSDTVAVGKGLVIEHRNAANNANINVLGGCAPAQTVDFSISRLTLATNERIRVIAGTAAGAASSMYLSAIGRRAA